MDYRTAFWIPKWNHKSAAILRDAFFEIGRNFERTLGRNVTPLDLICGCAITIFTIEKLFDEPNENGEVKK